MAWLPFTGASAGEDWILEWYALDPIDTCASIDVPEGLPVGILNTSWLNLTCAPVNATGLRVYIQAPFGEAVDGWPTLQAEINGTWYPVWGGSLDVGAPAIWRSFIIPGIRAPAGILTAIRLRFDNPSNAQPYTGLVCGSEYEVACSGPLADLCGFLHTIGDFFHDLADDLEGILVVGQHLSGPFNIVGDLFEDGAEICCRVSGELAALLAVIEGKGTWEALLALIQENEPTLYTLITDPVGWFLVQLTLTFDLEPWHTQSLEFFTKWVLETYFLTLYQIWLDPEDWLAILLEDRFPILYYLVVDPEGEILYLIGQVFDLPPYETQSAEFIVKALFERYFATLYHLWLDPEDWLVEHVDPRLLAVPEAIEAFLDDPWGWLFDRLEDRIETYAVRIGEISLEIIAKLLGV